MRRGSSFLAGLLLFTSLVTPIAVDGQRERVERNRSGAEMARRDASALDEGGFVVLIDLDENRLYFKQSEVTLWSAPVGTGTAMRLITDEEDWEFSTPRGRFQVQYKERDPVWIAPDWYFVENNLPVPSKDHPSRYKRGTLGEAAVYISPSLAIHGTDRPELLGQRVSHGCIRLENRYAMRLYHNVQVGTEVVIVGGEDVSGRVVDLREGYDPSLASRGSGQPPPPDPVLQEWKRLGTPALLRVLDEQLDAPSRTSRWDQVAILLVDRGVDGDEEALRALFDRAGALPSVGVRREWGTLLGEAYRRAAVASLEALTRLPSARRKEAAELLVTSLVTLHSGGFASASASWPSGRIPSSLVSDRAALGWQSLLEAEEDVRMRFDSREAGGVAR